jgi:phosphoglycolate phosphatase
MPPAGSPLRLALFDCDGTLVDSQHNIVTAMGKAFEAFGLTVPSTTAIRRIIGLPLVRAIAALHPTGNSAQHEALAEIYKKEFGAARALPEHQEPLFDGIVSVLEKLQAEGVLLGIATGKSKRGLDMVLEHHAIGHFFTTCQTSDIGFGKPHPDMALRALRETGVAARDTIMIGDSIFDMAMARAAGMKSIGVGWGYYGPKELAEAGADALVDEVRAIPPTLSRLWAA